MYNREGRLKIHKELTILLKAGKKKKNQPVNPKESRGCEQISEQNLMTQKTPETNSSK